MINNEVRSNIQKYGQEHLLKYYDTLSTKERSIYDEQLNNLNFGYLDINRENKNDKKYDWSLLSSLALYNFDLSSSWTILA